MGAAPEAGTAHRPLGVDPRELRRRELGRLLAPKHARRGSHVLQAREPRNPERHHERPPADIAADGSAHREAAQAARDRLSPRLQLGEIARRDDHASFERREPQARHEQLAGNDRRDHPSGKDRADQHDHRCQHEDLVRDRIEDLPEI